MKLDWFFTLLLTIALCGCAPSNGPSPEGQAYLMQSEPDESPEGVVDLKNALIVGTAPDENLLIGKVGGGQHETWDDSTASFLVHDLEFELTSHEHGDDHGDNCKFCQAEKAQELESMALVQVINDKGEPVPGHARELLGLQEGHVIIAQGTGELTEGSFVFSARRIYVRPE